MDFNQYPKQKGAGITCFFLLVLFLTCLYSTGLYAQDPGPGQVKVTVKVVSLCIGNADERCSNNHCNVEHPLWKLAAKTNLAPGFTPLRVFPQDGYGWEVGTGAGGCHDFDFYGEGGDYRTLINNTYNSLPSTVDIDFYCEEGSSKGKASIQQSIPLNFMANTDVNFTVNWGGPKFATAVISINYSFIPQTFFINHKRITNYCADDQIALNAKPGQLPAGLFYKWEYALEKDKVEKYNCEWVYAPSGDLLDCAQQQRANQESNEQQPTNNQSQTQCYDCADCWSDPGLPPSICHYLVKEPAGHEYQWKTINPTPTTNPDYLFIPRDHGIMNGGIGMPTHETMLIRFSIVNASGYSITPYQNEGPYTVFPASPTIPAILNPPGESAEYITTTNPLCVGSETGIITIKKSGTYKYTLINTAIKINIDIGFENNYVSPGTPVGSPVYVKLPTQEKVVFSGLKAGTYKILVENYVNDPVRGWITQCYSTSGDIVLTDPLPLTATAPSCSTCGITTPTRIKCIGGEETVAFTINGGTPPYKYNIVGSSNTIDVTGSPVSVPLKQGTYAFLVTDKYGCQTTSSNITLTDPPPITFSEGEIIKSLYAGDYYNISCKGKSDGSIEIFGIRGGSGSGYKVAVYKRISDDPESFPTPKVDDFVAAVAAVDGQGKPIYNKSFTGLSAGFYKIMIMDGNGCLSPLMPIEKEKAIELTEPPALVIADVDIDHTDCFENQADAFISFKATGGVPDPDLDLVGGYEYSLTYQNSTTIEFDNDSDDHSFNEDDGTVKFKNLAPGTYILNAVDMEGCPIDKKEVVIPNIIGMNTLSNIPPSCTGGNDGVIEIEGKGGIPLTTYSYEWKDKDGTVIGTGAKITGLAKGDYTVKVNDEGVAEGCFQIFPVTMEDRAPLGIQIGQTLMATQTICTGTTPTLAPTFINKVSDQTYTYQWTSDKGLTANTPTIQIQNKGWYKVKVTSNKGCVAEDIITIEEEELLLSLPPVLELCQGQRTTLDAGYPNASYTWKDKDGKLLGTNRLLEVVAEGTYQLKVVLQDGCTGYDIIEIKYGDYLPVDVPSRDNLCWGERISLDAGYANASYTWTDKDGKLLGTNRLLEVVAEGTYQLKVVLQDGCTGYDIIEIKYGDYLPVDVPSRDNLCWGERISLDAGYADASYTWKDKDGKLLGTNRLLEVAVDGTYHLKVVLQNGCTGYDVVNIKYGSYLPINLPSKVNLCRGEKINLDAGYSNAVYTWKNKDGALLGSNQLLQVSTDGTYYLKVILPSGCTGYDTVKVEYNPLSLHLAPDLINLCKGQSIELDGGFPDSGSQYEWRSSNPSFSGNKQKITVKDEGTYYFKVVLLSGCIGYDTLKIVTKTETLKADFLVSNISVVGDTVTAIDLTYPEPKDVLWQVLYNNVPVPITNNKQTYFDFIPTKEGWYTFRMTAYNYGCEDIKEKKIYVQDIGLNNPDAQAGGGQGAGTINDWVKEFSLYPNPNQGNFQCKVVLHEKASLTLMLYHASARQTMSEKKSGEAAEHLVAFNESQLAKGMYFLILEIAGQRKMLRFVVY